MVREWQLHGLKVILTYAVENLYAEWIHWLQADPPDVQKIPVADALGVTVVLLTCSYRQQEFVRVGYFINNEYTEPELKENPPAQPQFDKVSFRLCFNILYTNDGSGTYYLKGLFLLEGRDAAYKVRLLLSLTKPEIIIFLLKVCGYEVSLLCCTTVYRLLQLHCNVNLTVWGQFQIF